MSVSLIEHDAWNQILRGTIYNCYKLAEFLGNGASDLQDIKQQVNEEVKKEEIPSDTEHCKLQICYRYFSTPIEKIRVSTA